MKIKQKADLFILFIIINLIGSSVGTKNYRAFWDKDDENNNKLYSLKRRHVTSTAKTTAVETSSNRSAQIFNEGQTPPPSWYQSARTRAAENRAIERLSSSSLWGSHHFNQNSRAGHLNYKQAPAPPSGSGACSVPYRFGPRCEGICHCSTLLACDKTTGQCRSGICAHGFMDPPMCQRPCPAGQFGFRCGFYCHCWKGASCDSVNGFCAPDGKCAEEWFGPSCQIRKLELSDAPMVTVSNCEDITVSWRQWTSDLDFGNPEIIVKNYELEVRTPSRPQWRIIYRILNDDETIRLNRNKSLITFKYTPAPDTRFIQFRVVVNGLDTNGKYVTGVPSIPTEVFQRNCPTEAGGDGLITIETRPTTLYTVSTPQYTLPPALTPWSVIPGSSIETVPPATQSSTTTSTTQATTTIPVVSLSQYDLTNDPGRPGSVLVSWTLGSGSASLPQDAGLLVEMVGVGDCDPFQSTVGPQIFKINQLQNQTLKLERWRQYRITFLRSIAASDVNSASLARKHIVTAGNAPTAAVDNVQLEDVSTRSARLSWSPLACEDRGDNNVTYEVRLYRSTRVQARAAMSTSTTPPKVPFIVVPTNRTWVNFNTLSPAYEYTVEINAKNKYGTGPTGGITFTTVPEDRPLPAPQFLPATNIGPTSFTAVWALSPPSPGMVYPPIDNCELKVTSADSVPVFMERYPNCSITSKTVTDLNPNTRYLVELTQTAADGTISHQAMIVSTLEAQPGPPLNLVYRPLNKTCGKVDWDPPNPPNGAISNYSIFVSVLDSYLPLRKQSVDRYGQRENGKTLCNLMLSTKYSFSVQASTSAGLGPTAEVTFWTPIADPDPPPVPFARLSDEAISTIGETATIVVLAQPLRFSTGVITAYYLKLATVQQIKEYENIYGISANGTSLYVTPESKADSALAALPGRLVHRVLPDRFEQQTGGPLLHQALLEVQSNQHYRVVWAVAVQLEDHSRLSASVSEVVRVPGPPKTTTPESITTRPLQPSPVSPGVTERQVTIFNNTLKETDERVGWVFGIVIALIILLVIIAIIIILLCCCWKRFDAPQEEKPVQRWSSSEHVQTEEPPLQLEDWFNPTTQVDDSRYVVRGQRVLTPTRYTTTINTPR